MNTIQTITENVLRLMTPDDEWSYEDWWNKVVRNGKIPNKGTADYERWKGQRLSVKNAINDELRIQRKPERLRCIWGAGLKLEGKATVAKTYSIERVRKVVAAYTLSMAIFDDFISCTDLSENDKTMLTRLNGACETNLNAFAGAIGRMRSLAKEQKQKLLSEFGFDV